MKIGILGGGQLAQMMALAGIPLGLRFVCYDPTPDCCAASVARHIQAAYDNEEMLRLFANDVDLVTYEFENFPTKTVNFIDGILREKGSGVFPAENALHTTQDRLREKQLFQKLAIPTPAFIAIDKAADLERAAQELGLPLVLKSRSGGYDGKGQTVIRNSDDITLAGKNIAPGSLIAEAWVKFDREVSIIAVRSRSNTTLFYDLAENTHNNGILTTTFNRPADAMQLKAESLANTLIEALDYIGVIALEFFQQGENLFANEYAPRVHNTGHWTIEGAICCQFENHLRAILDWPVGSTQSCGYSGMINFIGECPEIQHYLSIPQVHYHHYGKAPRPGRKVGHATVLGQTDKAVNQQVKQLINRI